jgi:hypothetical protein
MKPYPAAQAIRRVRTHVLAVGAAFSAVAFQAQAHTIVGDRVFPATLTIDDPGVNDELALPSFSYMESINPDGSPSTFGYGLGWEYAKTITADLGVSVGSGFNWQTRPGAQGWSNIETQVKYVMWQDAKAEAIVAGAVSYEWGNTGSPQNASLPCDPFSTLTFKVYGGKGFGDAPADWLKPFAVTGEFDAGFPTIATNADGSLNPTTITYGATLQYSLLYMNSHVQEVPEMFRRLIPAFEAVFSTPVGNLAPYAPGEFGSNVTTGVVGPSLYYIGKYFEVGVMAQAPINRESGAHIGVLAVIDFFLDDIAPDTLGKPLFGPPQQHGRL